MPNSELLAKVGRRDQAKRSGISISLHRVQQLNSNAAHKSSTAVRVCCSKDKAWSFMVLEHLSEMEHLTLKGTLQNMAWLEGLELRAPLFSNFAGVSAMAWAGRQSPRANGNTERRFENALICSCSTRVALAQEEGNAVG